MDAPNIQLYNLFRQDLHLSDNKSLELMHVLDKEYKSGVKTDLVRFEQTMTDGFRKIDERFEKIDARFDKIDDRFINLDKDIVRLDNKIDLKHSELRVEIHGSKVDTIKWVVSIFFALALLIIGLYFKK
jgi:hypothetical protein